MVRIFGLQRADQKVELGKTSQTREAGIFQEVRPASEAGADAPLQPLKSSFAPSGQGERAGDLIVRMVRVPEGFGARTGSGHTFDGPISIPHQRVSRPCKLMMSGSFGTSCSASSI